MTHKITVDGIELCRTQVLPIAGIDRLIHEPARLMIMTYLYVARKRRLPLFDAPDRAYGWQSVLAYEQA